MSITKRVLALAAAGATALVLGGVLSTSHSPTRVDAAGPIGAAVGCANSDNPAAIQFTSLAASGIFGPSNQVTAGLPGNSQGGASSAPGTFSFFAPTGAVECGMVLQDLAAAGAVTPQQDADPNTVDGGTITYALTGGGAFTQILESNGPVANVQCGDANIPTGTSTFTGGTSAVQTLTIPAGATGTFTLTIGACTTSPIAVGASAATIQAALLAMPVTCIPAGTTVTGPVGGPFVITFPATAGAVPTITVNNAGIGAAAVPVVVTNLTATTITVTAFGATAGTFVLTGTTSPGLIPFQTGLLPFNATAAQIAAAIQAAALAAGQPVGFTVTAIAGFAGPINTSTAAVFLSTALGTGLSAPTISSTLTGAALTVTVVSTTTGVAGGTTTTATAPGGWESCQGAISIGANLSPQQGNVIHVGFRPGATFGVLGNSVLNTVTLTATYNRFPALNTANAVGPSTITASTTINIPLPVYLMSLTPVPATISAAVGGGGSVITAQMFRTTFGGCLPIAATGVSASGFVVCSAATFAVGGLLPGVTIFTPGVEPGVITFTTSAGFFSGTFGGTGSGFAGQVASVHCGAIGGTSPLITFPTNIAGFASDFPFFSGTGCNTAAVTLNGGGAVGDAIVTADFVGDFTGATAFNTTSVVLSPTAATVALSRGCNEVLTPASLVANATATQVLALVSPSSVVVSIWQFNNSLHAFQALYFNTAGAPTDISSVGPNQSIFICVSGAATFALS